MVSSSSGGDKLEGKRVTERYRVKTVCKWTEQTVFAVAEDMANGRLVDLILLDKSAVKNAEQFKKELERRGQIKHRNLVQILDSGTAVDDEYFIALEKCDYESLEQAFKGGARPSKDAVAVAFQIIDAALVLNKAQEPATPLYPQNILLEARNSFNPELKIRSLDLSEAALASGLLQQNEISPLARARFSAPEIFKGSKATEKSQVYTIGCFLYQLLTGHPPFDSDDLLELESQHLCIEPKRFHVSRPDIYINPALEAVILRALSKEPAARQSGLLQLKEQLNSNRHDNPILRSGWRNVAAILFLCAGIVLCSAYFLGLLPGGNQSLNPGQADPAIETPAQNDPGPSPEGLLSGLPAVPADANDLGDLVLTGNTVRHLSAGHYKCKRIEVSGNASLLTKGDGLVEIWLVPAASGAGENEKGGGLASFSLHGNGKVLSAGGSEQMRFYVFGADDIRISGNARVKADVLAPRALLDASGNAGIQGSFTSNGQKLSGQAKFLSEPSESEE